MDIRCDCAADDAMGHLRNMAVVVPLGHRVSRRRYWTAAAIRKLRRLYPNMDNKAIAKRLRRTLPGIDNMAHKLVLRKSAAFLAAHRFPKGLIPWNRGVTGYMGPNRTTFRKGQMPHNHKPVGSERVTKDGYLERKVREPKKWRAVHVLLWESVHGKVKRGHIVVFKAGVNKERRLSPVIADLECISREENMRRNTYHRYPKEIARLIQLRGALNRQINKRAQHEEQNRGSSQPPIRDNRGAQGQRQADAARPRQGNRGRGASHHQQRKGGSGLYAGRGRQQGDRLYPARRARSAATATHQRQVR
jgi:hypothetical protein